MNPAPAVGPITLPAHPEDPEITKAPAFAVAFYDSEEEPGEIDLIVHYTNDARADKTASNALMAGIALLIADKQGDLDHIVARTFPDGPPTELEAVATIDLLIEGEANDLPA